LKKSNQCCISDETLKQAFQIANELTPNDARLLINTAVDHRDQSIKADGGKLRMELIPTSAYIGLGRVLTHGAEKYSPNSWQNVEYQRYIGALIRHLVAFIDDPTGRDSDSGLLHTEHLLANAVFLNDAVAAGRIPTNERP
jgi:hypothetical protein